jgi:hypothetical protein
MSLEMQTLLFIFYMREFLRFDFYLKLKEINMIYTEEIHSENLFVKY